MMGFTREQCMALLTKEEQRLSRAERRALLTPRLLALRMGELKSDSKVEENRKASEAYQKSVERLARAKRQATP